METNIIKELIGKTFDKVVNIDDQYLIFRGKEKSYYFYHDQDCCESVELNDICGDLIDLENSPILQADETINARYDSETWTFYKFATINGYVTVRWVGNSNGYYSESVDFSEFKLSEKYNSLDREVYNKVMKL